MRDIELRQYEPPLPNDMIKLLDDKDITKVQENIIFIYHILFHIFLFSVFESIFFWFYIVDQEEKAFKKHFSQLKVISDLICINVDIELDPLYDYIDKEHKDYNNEVPVRFTLLLNGFLFCVIGLMNIILKWHDLKLCRINIYIIKQNSVVLCGLFCYEYLFFQNIIYNYKPKSVMNIESFLFNKCKQE